MSDFEDRLRDALGSGADEAPDAHGLADGARTRARTRRRTTTGVVAAVAIAVIAVPLGAFALRDSGSDHSDVPVVDASDSSVPETSTTPSLPDGWRTESWRDLEIQVPDSWGYGALSTWCIGHDEPGEPFVQRPDVVVRLIGCTPSNGYGVQFFDPALFDAKHTPGEVHQIPDGSRQIYPAGSWVGHWGSDGDAAVLVVAPTEEIARQILDSATTVGEVDSNGCAPRYGATVSSEVAPGDERVSVCRYDADGWLVQSERLSEEDTGAAMAALAAAPMRREQEACPSTPERYDTVVIGTGQDLGSVRVVWGSTCAGGRGVYFSGVVRELTADVMYWALSPGWSGGVDGDVPLPPELRR